jgi:hypothetical protein
MGLGECAIAMPDPALVGRDNPAFLGVARERGLRVSLFDVALAAGNDAFSLTDYSTYNGATLSEDDEDDLMAKLGDDGLVVGGAGVGYGPSFAWRALAITTRASGGGGGRIPRAVFDLVLDGNTVDETVDFSEATGEAWAAAEVGFAMGMAIGGIAGGESSIGARTRAVRGFYYAGVRSAEGRLVTLPDTLIGSARMDLLTARGGSGYALDIGALHNRGSVSVGLRVLGLLSHLKWDVDPEIRRYTASADGDALLEFGDEDSTSTESEFVTETDSTFAAPAFTTKMPLRIGVGVAHQRGSWLFAGDLEHTSRGRAIGERPLRLSIGVERLLIGRTLRVRAGALVGGIAGPAAMGGLTFMAGPWRLDLDAGTYATWSPASPKGARLALGTAFIFG